MINEHVLVLVNMLPLKAALIKLSRHRYIFVRLDMLASEVVLCKRSSHVLVRYYPNMLVWVRNDLHMLASKEDLDKLGRHQLVSHDLHKPVSLVAQGKLGKHQAASQEVHYQSNQVRQDTEDWQDRRPVARHTWQC